MVYEKFYENSEPFYIWKCILCGEHLDDVIVKNRLLHKLVRKRSKKIPNASYHNQKIRFLPIVLSKTDVQLPQTKVLFEVRYAEKKAGDGEVRVDVYYDDLYLGV